MKITYENLIKFDNIAARWLKNLNNENTKLGYAIKKVSKKITVLLKPVSELDEQLQIDVEDIRSDNALTDPTTKAFIYDLVGEVRHYKYTPETRKKRDNEIRIKIKQYNVDVEKLLSQEIEFTTPYFATEIPKDLTLEEKDAFKEIVIKK